MTPIVEYVDFMTDGLIGPPKLFPSFFETFTLLRKAGTDEPFPLNLSRYFWLMSQQSQRYFEANVLAYGKN